MVRGGSSGSAGSGHVPALDGVRGLAILLVLVYHETLLSATEGATLADRWFAQVCHAGWSGVDLFFVLSGFLISGILLDAKGRPHYFRNFYARRTLRIFPLYYAVVFLSLVVIPNLPAGFVPIDKLANFGRIEGDEIWYWLYLSNFSIAQAGEWRHGILDISWSLAIEEQFYLVWPAIVLCCSRRTLQRLCVGIVLVSPVLRLAAVLLGFDPIAIYVLTPLRLDPLAVGALIACFVRSERGLDALAPHAPRVLVASVLGLMALWGWRGDLAALDPAVQVVGFSLLALAFGGLLVQTLKARPGGPLAGFFTHPVMRVFGKYSYALYLFHLPLRAMVRDGFYGRDDLWTLFGSQIPGQLVFYAISTALALVAAKLSWELYERRWLELKRFFPVAPSAPRWGAAAVSDERR